MLATCWVRWSGTNPVLLLGVSLVSFLVDCGTWPAWVMLEGHVLSKEHCLDFCTKASLMNNKNLCKPMCFISLLCASCWRVLLASPLLQSQEEAHPKMSMGIRLNDRTLIPIELQYACPIKPLLYWAQLQVRGLPGIATAVLFPGQTQCLMWGNSPVLQFLCLVWAGGSSCWSCLIPGFSADLHLMWLLPFYLHSLFYFE